MTDLTRRAVLALPGVACLAACAPSSEPPAAGTELASLDELPLGELVVKDKVVLKRTSDTEVTAFTAVCTHTGCTVGSQKTKLVCPCHGSEYDDTGKVTKGPAQENLGAVAVTVKDGKVLAGQ